MKHMKKITLTLLTAMVLVAVLMTGCTKLTEVKNNTPSTTDAPAEAGEYGVYIDWGVMTSAPSTSTAAAFQRTMKTRTARR